jgi:hypothetical protein
MVYCEVGHELLYIFRSINGREKFYFTLGTEMYRAWGGVVVKALRY